MMEIYQQHAQLDIAKYVPAKYCLCGTRFFRKPGCVFHYLFRTHLLSCGEQWWHISVSDTSHFKAAKQNQSSMNIDESFREMCNLKFVKYADGFAVLFGCCNVHQFSWIPVTHLPLPFRVASLELGQSYMTAPVQVNSSPSEQNGHRFADDIFRCIFANEKFYILIRISLKFVH